MEKQQREEHLEKIWNLGEKGDVNIENLSSAMGAGYNPHCLEVLEKEGLINVIKETGAVSFTEKGREAARKIIRSHRIAERLIADVLGGEFETAACEFEHLTNTALVDSLCTLLGHPRECPHGMPIPEGECCRLASDTIRAPIIPLTELAIGAEAEIAYVQTRDKREIHLLEGLQFRPGTTVKMHQKHPAYVIEAEGAQIAVDDDLAGNIKVWAPGSGKQPTQEPETERNPPRHRRGFFRHRGRHR